jgi:hypothetical protein
MKPLTIAGHSLSDLNTGTLEREFSWARQRDNGKGNVDDVLAAIQEELAKRLGVTENEKRVEGVLTPEEVSEVRGASVEELTEGLRDINNLDTLTPVAIAARDLMREVLAAKSADPVIEVRGEQDSTMPMDIGKMSAIKLAETFSLAELQSMSAELGISSGRSAFSESGPSASLVTKMESVTAAIAIIENEGIENIEPINSVIEPGGAGEELRNTVAPVNNGPLTNIENYITKGGKFAMSADLPENHPKAPHIWKGEDNEYYATITNPLFENDSRSPRFITGLRLMDLSPEDKAKLFTELTGKDLSVEQRMEYLASLGKKEEAAAETSRSTPYNIREILVGKMAANKSGIIFDPNSFVEVAAPISSPKIESGSGVVTQEMLEREVVAAERTLESFGLDSLSRIVASLENETRPLFVAQKLALQAVLERESQKPREKQSDFGLAPEVLSEVPAELSEIVDDKLEEVGGWLTNVRSRISEGWQNFKDGQEANNVYLMREHRARLDKARSQPKRNGFDNQTYDEHQTPLTGERGEELFGKIVDTLLTGLDPKGLSVVSTETKERLSELRAIMVRGVQEEAPEDGLARLLKDRATEAAYNEYMVLHEPLRQEGNRLREAELHLAESLPELADIEDTAAGQVILAERGRDYLIEVVAQARAIARNGSGVKSFGTKITKEGELDLQKARRVLAEVTVNDSLESPTREVPVFPGTHSVPGYVPEVEKSQLTFVKINDLENLLSRASHVNVQISPRMLHSYDEETYRKTPSGFSGSIAYLTLEDAEKRLGAWKSEMQATAEQLSNQYDPEHVQRLLENLPKYISEASMEITALEQQIARSRDSEELTRELVSTKDSRVERIEGMMQQKNLLTMAAKIQRQRDIDTQAQKVEVGEAEAV